MKAMLVIETKNGFAIAPYTGAIPDNFVGDMSVSSKLTSYSYGTNTVIESLEAYFIKPSEPVPLEVAA